MSILDGGSASSTTGLSIDGGSALGLIAPTSLTGNNTAQPGWAQPGWAVPGTGAGFAPTPAPTPTPTPLAAAPLYSTPVIPHLALPLTIGPDGSFNVLAQDTVEEVAQSVGVLLGTTLGERTMVPSYGVSDPDFTVPDAGEIVQAISQWEPRADATVTISTDGSGTQTMNVDVALVTAGS